jgi:hypothetical protein
MIIIYSLDDPISGLPRYIGKSKNPKLRFLGHCGKTHYRKTHKNNWIASLKKRGLKPILSIVDEVPEDDWKYWEKYWIMQMRAWGFDLVNHTEGGEGLSFGNQTSFKKGSQPWNKDKGYKKLCVYCQKEFKISPSLDKYVNCCSIKCSLEYRKLHGLYKGVFKKGHIPWHMGTKGVYKSNRKGIPLSFDTRNKISNTLKGHTYSKKRSVKQFNKQQELINVFQSMKLASDSTGIGYGCIANVVTGRAKTAGGFLWQ